MLNLCFARFEVLWVHLEQGLWVGRELAEDFAPKKEHTKRGHVGILGGERENSRQT